MTQTKAKRGRPSTKKAASKKSRKSHTRRMKTDFSHLQEADPDNQYRLVLNEGGQVQQRLADGWVTVTGDSPGGRYDPDAHTNSTEDTAPKGGVIRISAGKSTDAELILMKTSKANFDEMERAPIRQRMEDIDAALKGGQNQSGDNSVNSYAPKLPDGSGTGLSETKSNQLE